MSDEAAVAWLRQVIEGDKARWQDPVMCAALDEIRDRIADCEAKLGLLDEHYILAAGDQNPAYEDFSVYYRSPSDDCDFGCVCCHYYAQGAVRNFGYCRTVRLLASGYRHREGYAEHWDEAVNSGNPRARVPRSSSPTAGSAGLP
jgi:hypothetical protein